MNQKVISTLLLTATLLLAAITTHAQTTFSIGPRVGLNLANVKYKFQNHDFKTNSKAGLEAGLLVNVGFGHFAVQPAVLYSQMGFNIDDSYQLPGSYSSVGVVTKTNNSEYRLNYLAVPLNLAYTQGANGQGLQLFAGPYVGFLLGGTYRNDVQYSAAGTGTLASNNDEGDIGIGNYYTSDNNADGRFYSRKLDAGLQFGLGYRLGGALVQAGYSMGLRNLGADYKASSGNRLSDGPRFSSRALQFSFTYLFGSGKN